MKEFYKEYIEIPFMLFTIIVGLFIGMFLIILLFESTIGYYMSKTKCENKYGNEIEYYVLGGCMINYKGKYIPEELYIKTFEQNINLLK